MASTSEPGQDACVRTLTFVAVVIAASGCGTIDESANAGVDAADSFADGAILETGSDTCPASIGGYCNNEGPVFCRRAMCVDATHYRVPNMPKAVHGGSVLPDQLRGLVRDRVRRHRLRL
jgi:hypothetical protein